MDHSGKPHTTSVNSTFKAHSSPHFFHLSGYSLKTIYSLSPCGIAGASFIWPKYPDNARRIASETETVPVPSIADDRFTDWIGDGSLCENLKKVLRIAASGTKLQHAG
jgi:hypothetical protein